MDCRIRHRPASLLRPRTWSTEMKAILLRVASVLCRALLLALVLCSFLFLALLLLCVLYIRSAAPVYNMIVLNQSAQQVVVYYRGWGDTEWDYPVQACSVYMVSHVMAPVPISVRVVDSTGREVLKAEVEPRKVHPSTSYQVDVLIPADEPMACPSTIRNRYVVVVDNDDDESVCVFIDDVKLGCVEPNSVTTLGPVEGTLTYPPRSAVTDMEGATVLYFSELSYPLSAEVGEYRIRVRKHVIRTWAP